MQAIAFYVMLFAVICLPAGVIGAGFYGVSALALKCPGWRPTKYALGASWIVLAAFSLFVFVSIATSEDPNSILGIAALAFYGLPLFLVVYVVVWAVATLALRRRAGRQEAGQPLAPGRLRVFLATAVAVLALLLVTAFGYSEALRQRAKSLESPDDLGGLYSQRWVQYDKRILREIARNGNTPRSCWPS